MPDIDLSIDRPKMKSYFFVGDRIQKMGLKVTCVQVVCLCKKSGIDLWVLGGTQSEQQQRLSDLSIIAPGPVRCENAWYRSVTSQQRIGPGKGDCG
jgi:hypothetical protein